MGWSCATGLQKETMKIAVVGAGVVGIVTAYELALDGHSVTVLEKAAAACEGASFANNGVVAPSFTQPFSTPEWHTNSLARLIRSARRLTRRPWNSAQQLKWLRRWTKLHAPANYSEAQRAGQQLATYSAERLNHIADACKLELERSEGQLLLLRTTTAPDELQAVLEALKAQDIACKLLTAEEARHHEPALHAAAPFQGALWLPGNQVANCRQFALLLRQEAQRLGVQFRFNTTVQQLHAHAKPSVDLLTDGGRDTQSFDHIVFCTGGLPEVLPTTWRQRMPVMALHGYVLSVTVREPLNAPRSAVQDLQTGVTINRLGQRIRVSGGAELGDDSGAKDAATVNQLYRTLEQYYPGAANYPSGTQVWRGTRHLIADGMPLIGPSGLAGVSLNLGHGANGWTLACGSARLLADLVGAKDPALPTAHLLPTRFGT